MDKPITNCIPSAANMFSIKPNMSVPIAFAVIPISNDRRRPIESAIRPQIVLLTNIPNGAAANNKPFQYFVFLNCVKCCWIGTGHSK